MPVHHIDQATLEAALFGYGAQLGTIEVKIAQIRRQLGGRAPTDAAGIRPKMPRQKRTMSAAARKRIAVGQRTGNPRPSEPALNHFRYVGILAGCVPSSDTTLPISPKFEVIARGRYRVCGE